MKWTRKDYLAGFLIFGAALCLRFLFAYEYLENVTLDVSQVEQTENHDTAEWARSIADGNTLSEGLSPTPHFWARSVVPDGYWEEWAGGENALPHAPLYPYLLAVLFRTVGTEKYHVVYFHILLGALTCLLTFALGRRLVSFWCGVVSGLLLAFCSPHYFHDVFINRDGISTLVVVCLALVLDAAMQKQRTRDWLLLGATLGVFALVRDLGSVLLLLALGGTVFALRAVPRKAFRTGGLILVGFVILLAPVVVRNIVVDAPPTQIGSRGPVEFINGNAAGQTGLEWNPNPPLIRSILLTSDYSMPHVMAFTLVTHRSAPLGFLGLVWDKVCAVFHGEERPGVIDYQHIRGELSTPTLGGVSVTFLGPAALLGLLLGLRQRRRLRSVYFLFLGILFLLLCSHIEGATRVLLLPFMAFYSAMTLKWAYDAVKSRKILSLAAAGIVFSGLCCWAWPETNEQTVLSQKMSLMIMHVIAGDEKEATQARERMGELLVEIDADDPEGGPGRLRDDIDAAFEKFSSSFDPDNTSEAEKARDRGTALMMFVPIASSNQRGLLVENARAFFTRAQEHDPEIEGVKYQLGRLDALLGDSRSALIHYIDEIEAHPGHALSQRELGLLLYEDAKYLAAAQYIESALLELKDDPLLYTTAALLRINRSTEGKQLVLSDGSQWVAFDPEAAMERVKLAQELVIRDPRALRRLALTLYALGRQQGIRERLEESLVLFQQLREDHEGWAGESDRMIRIIETEIDRHP